MEHVISLARDALKTLLLINGGAAVALLAFFGQVAFKAPKDLIPSMAPVLWWFGLGVFLCALASVLAFIGGFLFALVDDAWVDDAALRSVGEQMAAGARKNLPKDAQLVLAAGTVGAAILIITTMGALAGCFCFARGAWLAVETLRTFPWVVP